MGTSGDGSDKRLHPRIPFILKVDYPNKKACADATENLSEGGLFIQTDQHFDMGQIVPLSLSFPGLLDPIEIVGTVAWVRPPKVGVAAGVGISVDRPNDRKRLEQLLGEAANKPAVPPSTPTVAPQLQGYRVLIVDDSPHILEMYSYALKKLAATELKGKATLEVAFAGDGEQALAQVHDRHFDLVMTDLSMPVMDGFELIERIRGDAGLKSLPVVAISALDRRDAEPRALALGVDLFLQKPLRLAQVLETVKRLLRLP